MEFADPELLRDIFVGCESLRNSVNLLRDYLDAWVAVRLDYATSLSLEQIDHLRCLWATLIIDPDVVEVSVGRLQLRFESGRLLISATCACDENLVDMVKSSLLASWSFCRFTESTFFCLVLSRP